MCTAHPPARRKGVNVFISVQKKTNSGGGLYIDIDSSNLVAKRPVKNMNLGIWRIFNTNHVQLNLQYVSNEQSSNLPSVELYIKFDLWQLCISYSFCCTICADRDQMFVHFINFADCLKSCFPQNYSLVTHSTLVPNFPIFKRPFIVTFYWYATERWYVRVDSLSINQFNHLLSHYMRNDLINFRGTPIVKLNALLFLLQRLCVQNMKCRNTAMLAVSPASFVLANLIFKKKIQLGYYSLVIFKKLQF